MHMHSDDELYEVDSVFLGPRGLTFPWRARYQAYGIGLALTILLLIVLQSVGLMSFWPITYGLVVIIWATRKLTPHITHDNSAKSLLTTFWNDVRAPRSRHEHEVITRMSPKGIRRRSYL